MAALTYAVPPTHPPKSSSGESPGTGQGRGLFTQFSRSRRIGGTRTPIGPLLVPGRQGFRPSSDNDVEVPIAQSIFVLRIIDCIDRDAEVLQGFSLEYAKRATFDFPSFHSPSDGKRAVLTLYPPPTTRPAQASIASPTNTNSRMSSTTWAVRPLDLIRDFEGHAFLIACDQAPI
jgi:hypothetical protein